MLTRLLEAAAQRGGDRVAVIDAQRSITYGELDRATNRAARLLLASGVWRSDRVLLAMSNSVEFVVGYFGVLKAGAIAVPVASGERSDRLEAIVRDCEPAAYIVDRGAWPAVRQATTGGAARPTFVVACGQRVSDRHATDFNLAIGAHSDSGLPRVGIDIDLAAVIYTSGTTGVPRGVMLTHLNLTTNAESIVEYLHLTDADRVIAVLPFNYAYGLSLLHTHVAVGGSMVIQNTFAFPGAVLTAMKDHRVTGLAGVSTTFAILLRRSAIRTTPLPDLRYVTQAGGPMPPALIRDWRAAMPSVPLFVMYGSTEAAARLAYLEPAELDGREGSIGRAIPNVELRVLRDDDRPAAPGEVGELVARGSNIASGYWNNEADTRIRFGPHGFRTGDLAYADADGRFYLVGRKYDMLKIGAHRVGSKEIEDVLYEHPAVVDAVVVPVDEELLGEVPLAFVAVGEGSAASPDDLIAFCRERLIAYKVPARVEVRAELPKNASGKPDRAALREEGKRIVASAPCLTTF